MARPGDVWQRGLSRELFGGNESVLIAVSIALYMIVSTTLLLTTSALVRTFRIPGTVTSIQMVTSVVAMAVLLPLTIRGTWRAALRWALVVPVLFGISLVTSSLASTEARLGTVMIFRYLRNPFMQKL